MGDAVGRQIRVGLVVLSLGLSVRPSSALELWSDDQGRQGHLDITGKVTSLVSDMPIPFTDQDRTTLARLRLGLGVRHSDWMDSELAYEQRARHSSGVGFGLLGRLLPSEAEAPFRLAPLDWAIAGDDAWSYRHEIDRGLVALHPEWGEVTVGRQAIGLGRGVLFGAVDMFSPFSPLEVDREWRRGVDAVRAEYRLSATSSAEVLGVFGETWDDSALLGRLRGYLGDIDGSLILGKRAEDIMVGGTVSTIVHDAEVHAELALFDTPEAQFDGGLWGDDHLVTKAVLGSSYTFDVGGGLTVLGEYHYSGFGVKDAGDVLTWLQSPTVQERLLRGDTQILGRHALAGQLNYPFDDAVMGGLMVLVSPVDGSGVLAPSLRLDLDKNVTLIGSVYVPWGHKPAAGQLQSEYGATPTSLFLQANIYY